MTSLCCADLAVHAFLRLLHFRCMVLGVAFFFYMSRPLFGDVASSRRSLHARHDMPFFFYLRSRISFRRVVRMMTDRSFF